MGRFFKKISFEQFKRDVSDDKNLYDLYTLPKRSTKKSAGYDFVAINDLVIEPNEIVKIPLGIKCCFEDDEALLLIVRSGMGFKNIRMCNQVGLFDSDYYDNPTNEGHMWLKLQNHGHEPFTIKKGDKICQGVFIKYLTVDDEEEITNVRIGGLGSTN